MHQPKFSLASVPLLVTAAPLWGIVIVFASQSTGFGSSTSRFVTAPVVLCTITVAIHRLIRRQPNAWAKSILAAGVIAFGSLAMATWFAS